MGSAQGKSKDTLTTTPIPIDSRVPDSISPLHALAASLGQPAPDPRSPGYRRTPVSTPYESPCATPPSVARHKMIQRLGSASKFGALDPRSPASRRTPLRDVSSNEGRVLPPPFSLGGQGDPRSPSIITRTPLVVSGQDAVVVPDDIELAEEIIGESYEAAATASSDKGGKAVEQTLERETSAGAESMCEKVTVETFSSPEYTPSATIMALTMSPLNSPIGSRKRRSITNKMQSHSPLKKSYSAPVDENDAPNPTSPSIKSLKRVPRAPLSPLSQSRNINSRHCMGVQPIKLRMDPAILG